MTDFEKRMVTSTVMNCKDSLRGIIVRATKAQFACSAKITCKINTGINPLVITISDINSVVSENINLHFNKYTGILISSNVSGSTCKINALCKSFMTLVRNYAKDKVTLGKEYEQLKKAYAKSKWYNDTSKIIANRMAEIEAHMKNYEDMKEVLDILINC